MHQSRLGSIWCHTRYSVSVKVSNWVRDEGLQWSSGKLREAFSLGSCAAFVRTTRRGIHPVFEMWPRSGERRWIRHCVPQTQAGRDDGWFNGVRLRCVWYAVIVPCMRLLMRGRLYDSQNMTHSSLASDFSRDVKSLTVHHITELTSLLNDDVNRRCSDHHASFTRVDATALYLSFVCIFSTCWIIRHEQGDTVFICGSPSAGVKHNKLLHPMLPKLTHLSVTSQFYVIAK